jgi:methionyl-tRNA formyltransferase
LSKEPGAYSIIDNNAVKIYASYIGGKTDDEPGVITNIYKEGIGVATLDNELVITKIKPAGKKIMNVKNYLNGFKGESLLGKKLK